MAAATVAGRPAGRLMAMPLIVINMGAEMLYILAHRLDAQKIGETKSVRVLEDVVRTMFDPAFVEELFRPHDTYSRSSTRGIFDKLAHSSIMRLNKNSMDKLYDLMTMGFKYQILQCVCADQLYAVTMRHLATVLALVGKALSRARAFRAAQLLLHRGPGGEMTRRMVGHVRKSTRSIVNSWMRFTRKTQRALGPTSRSSRW